MARGGLILYKADWTEAADVEDALVQALSFLERRKPEQLTPLYSERVGWRQNDPAAFRAGLERTGPQAVRDFYGGS